MKPLSNDKSRAKALKDFLADGAGRSIEHMERFAQECRDRCLTGIVDDEGYPSGFFPGAGWQELDIAAHAAARGGWQASGVHRLDAATEYLWLNARSLDAIGAPKVDGPDYVADSGSSALLQTIWTALLYAHSSHWDRAAWLGSYLHGYLTGPDLRCVSNVEDLEYADLLRLLMEALAQGRWPASFPASLGPYQRWLEQRLNPAGAEAALQGVLDMRMARYHNYRDVDWPKPQRPSQDTFIMGVFTYVAIPAELWAVQAMTRRYDGVELTLAGGHPWLTAPFMSMPSSVSLGFEDDLTRALRAAGDRQFRAGWAGLFEP